MPLVERAADGDEMHDRKNPLTLEQLALERMRVGQKPRHVRVRAERRRLARAEIGVDFSCGEQFAERSPGRVLFDRHRLEQRQRMWVAVAAAGLDRALHPVDLVDVDAELMHQVTARPD